MNDIAILATKSGKFAIVDAEMMPTLQQRRWYPTKSGYFMSGRGKSRVYLHRIVNCTPPGFETDHKNRLRFDNRRRNLRTATEVQNLTQNTEKHRDSCAISTSQYKGVFRIVRYGVPENKWRAKIGRMNLGTFLSEIAAALAYNKAALEQYGEFAYLNKVEK